MVFPTFTLRFGSTFIFRFSLSLHGMGMIRREIHTNPSGITINYQNKLDVPVNKLACSLSCGIDGSLGGFGFMQRCELNNIATSCYVFMALILSFILESPNIGANDYRQLTMLMESGIFMVGGKPNAIY